MKKVIYMKKNKTLKLVSLLLVSVLVLTMLSGCISEKKETPAPTTAAPTTTETSTSGGELPELVFPPRADNSRFAKFLGYKTSESSELGYAEFGAIRGAIYGAIKEEGLNAFDLNWLSSETGLSKEAVSNSLQKMLNEKYLGLRMSLSPGRSTWFPYYVVYAPVKLKPGTPESVKEELGQKIRDEMFFCTSYELKGDFDFWIGWHNESWETTKERALDPYLENDAWPIENYIIQPISAQIRHGGTNTGEAAGDKAYTFSFPDHFDNLPSVTGGKLNSDDVAVIKALNEKNLNEFDWGTIAKYSPKTESELKDLLEGLRESTSLIGPFWAINEEKLGITSHWFFVQVNPLATCDKMCEYLDKVQDINDLHLIYYHHDSITAFTLAAWEGLADINEIRNQLKAIFGDDLINIYEAEQIQQYRWWTTLWYGDKWNTPGGAYTYKRSK